MRLKNIGLIVLLGSFGYADTITTRDSRTWNGDVTSIQNGVLTLSAAFPSGPATLTFGADYIRAIEFNSLRTNPGANPGKTLPAPNPQPPKLPATIYMQQKKPFLSCQDITSAANSVQLSCGSNVVAKKDVLRILVGAQ